VCGNAGEPPPPGLVASSDDCCDRHPDMFPGQTLLFSTPQRICPDELPFDYNCNRLQQGDDQLGGGCNSLSSCITGWASVPACGAVGALSICARVQITRPGEGTTTECRPGGSPSMSPARRCN
jgi:hypothetical protein